MDKKPAVVLTPLGLAVCASLFGDMTLYTVLVTQLEVVGLTLAAVGVMLGVNRLVRIPTNPLVGWLVDRWGRRRLFLAGMTLGVLSTAGYGLVYGFWPFLLSRAAWGIGWTLINVSGTTMALDISTPANRGRVVGTYNAWMLVGFTAGPLLGGYLVDTLGFRPAMLTFAGVTALGLLVVLFFLPETRPRQTDQPDDGLSGLTRRLRSLWGRRLALVQAHRGLIATSGLYLLMLFAGEGIVLSTVTLLLQQRFGERMALGAVVVGVSTGAGILLGGRSLLAGLVGPLAGHLSDRKTGRLPMISLSLLLGIASFLLMSFGRDLTVVTAGIVLSAVSAGTGLAVVTAFMGDQTPAGRQGAVMGLYAAVGDVGSMSGPFLAFALATRVSLAWIYLLSAVLFAAGFGLVYLSRRATAS